MTENSKGRAPVENREGRGTVRPTKISESEVSTPRGVLTEGGAA